MMENDFAAVILAAGLSSRMESPKVILPMGGETVIEKVIGLFRRAAISEVLVVLGHEAERVSPYLKKNRGIRWVINEDYRSGMFSSIQKGAASIDGKCRGFFVIPADMPLVKTETLTMLMAAFQDDRECVIRPCHKKRRGHPPLISASLITAILDFNGAGGLRAFFARAENLIIDIECDDPGIFIDVDTPEDYRKALYYFDHGIIP